MTLQNNKENERKWFDEICENLEIQNQTKKSILMIIESHRDTLGYPVTFKEAESVIHQALNYLFK